MEMLSDIDSKTKIEEPTVLGGDITKNKTVANWIEATVLTIPFLWSFEKS